MVKNNLYISSSVYSTTRYRTFCNFDLTTILYSPKNQISQFFNNLGRHISHKYKLILESKQKKIFEKHTPIWSHANENKKKNICGPMLMKTENKIAKQNK